MEIYKKRILPDVSLAKSAAQRNLAVLNKEELIRQKKRAKRKKYLKLAAIFLTILAICYIVLALASIPSAIKSVAYATEGVKDMQTGLGRITKDSPQAKELFLKSSANFTAASQSLQSMNVTSKLIFTLPKGRSIVHLLKVANHLSAVGAHLSLIMEDQEAVTALGKIDITSGKVETILSNYLVPLENFLAKNEKNLSAVNSSLKAADRELRQVDVDSLPNNMKGFVGLWQKKLPTMTKYSQLAADLATEREQVFGKDGDPRRYLILFQNDTELRPAGGFLGSFAVLTIEGEKATEWWVQKNIYSQDKAFEANHKIPITGPLKELWPNWTMKDSNWDISFPEAAKDVSWFYQAEVGKRADGVLALDTTVIEDLLKLTGPIKVTGYDFTIDAKNFVSRTQEHVELDYFEDQARIAENQPKKYIADLSQVLMQSLISLPENKRSELGLILARALTRKSILLALAPFAFSLDLLDLNIDGHAPAVEDGDFLYLVNANIGGKKSSRNLWQSTSLKTVVNRDGTASHQLTISRKHQGDGKWPDGDNKNYLQIMVPKGTKLLSQKWPNDSQNDEKISITEESGMTVFGIWFSTPVGQEKTLTISYQTPKVATDGEYKIYHQKQPGAQHCQLKQTVSFPHRVRGFSGAVSLQKTSPMTIETSFQQTQDQQIIVEF